MTVSIQFGLAHFYLRSFYVYCLQKVLRKIEEKRKTRDLIQTKAEWKETKEPEATILCYTNIFILFLQSFTEKQAKTFIIL